MRARSLAFAAVLLGAGLRACPLPAAEPAQGMDFTDDVGRHVVLHLPVRRAVVFNGATTELIRSIVGMDVVVGVDAETMKNPAYWPGVTAAMIVGQNQRTPNYEAIIGKHPDVVFLPRNGDWQRAAETLKPFGIPVVVLTAWDLRRNDFNVELIGRIFERQASAAGLLDDCHRLGASLTQRLRGVTPKTVYLEQQRILTTPLKGSGWNDMIEVAGAINLFHDVNAGEKPTARGDNQMFEIDPEQVLSRKPDLIVKIEPATYPPPPDEAMAAMLAGIAARPGFARLEAVRTRQVYAMSGLLSHACSKLMGSVQLAKWLYPERFADLDPSRDANDWLRRQGVQPVATFWTRLGERP